MENLFKEKASIIYIYTGKENIIDPYEKNVETILLPPIPIKAIVTDLIFSQIQWKMVGVTTSKAKEIIIEKKWEKLLKLSHRIKIGDEYYYGWRINEKLQYRIEQNYLRVYIYIKKET